ncbi:TPM domain-containing protein [Gangjinia marincola]|uniref:TPM domain-containing protein n=1 Tax=Gangjinia marincola TaxID=578463 RepID=A0ABP3XQ38_9FLAO
MKVLQHFLIYLLVLTGVCSSLMAQRDIPPKPSKQTSVYDDANLLSGVEKSQLEQKLIRYADTTSTQIVVATINSLDGEYIGTYAAHWAAIWGIGQAKEDNGLLILVAKNDRKIWITTGYGLEEYMTDLRSKEIIDQIITPQFKQGNFYAGLDQGTTAIMQTLSGTFKGVPVKRNASGDGFPFQIVLFIIFIIVLFALSKNRRGGGRNGGRRSTTATNILEAIILSNMGRGGFGGGSSWGGSSGGGSFGGGGFGGGFGGGGFGGGGAGGSW